MGLTNPLIPGAPSMGQPGVTSHFAHSLMVVDANGPVRPFPTDSRYLPQPPKLQQTRNVFIRGKNAHPWSRITTMVPKPFKATRTGIIPPLLEIENNSHVVKVRAFETHGIRCCVKVGTPIG